MNLYQRRLRAYICDQVFIAFIGSFITFWIPDVYPLKTILVYIVISLLFVFKDIIGIGKRIYKIKVISTLPNDLNMWQIVLRNITVFIWPIEAYLVLMRQKLRLGDRLAKTDIALKE
jgi:uncharacterized RDD family membrane protein YckC